MKIAEPFKTCGLDEIKAELAGGKLVIYSVARPKSPDARVERSGVLATLTFAAPAFNGDGAAAENGLPLFAANPVVATGTGTPGFARAFKADGTTVVADFTAGAGDSEVKLSEISASANYPIKLTKLKLELPAV